MSPAKPEFRDLVEQFPLVELPYSVTPESYNAIADERKPISEEIAVEFLNFEDEPYDEFTEFIPVSWLLGVDNFFALVLWRANLSGERYLLCTFDKEGQFIDKVHLAGTFYTDKGLSYAVGAISKDLRIFVKGGLDSMNVESIWDETDKTNIMYSILEDGTIELML
jgi:hypothetical protein